MMTPVLGRLPMAADYFQPSIGTWASASRSRWLITESSCSSLPSPRPLPRLARVGSNGAAAPENEPWQVHGTEPD